MRNVIVGHEKPHVSIYEIWPNYQIYICKQQGGRFKHVEGCGLTPSEAYDGFKKYIKLWGIKERAAN